MQNRLHFISGLPRSGSTLLAALLRQNPRFSAFMSSPVYAFFCAMLTQTSARNEGSVFIDDAIRKRLLVSTFDAYYHDTPPETVIFDTNRGWTTKLSRLVELFLAAKIAKADVSVRTLFAVCLADPSEAKAGSGEPARAVADYVVFRTPLAAACSDR